MFTTRFPRSPSFVERRKSESSANDGEFQPRSRGEREWLTGQPEIPAIRALPDKIDMAASIHRRGGKINCPP